MNESFAYGEGSKMDWQDVAIRAVKTFVQTFLASFPVAEALNLNVTSAKAAALAGGSAAIAVVWNALNQWSQT